MAKEEYFTLTGYHQKEDTQISYAMEDYIEMLYRHRNQKIKLKELALFLNVTSPSASIMIKRLRILELVNKNNLSLTKKGNILGEYLLYRHNILICFFKFLNKQDYHLEQVEKIEHFIDYSTIKNIEKFIKKIA